MKLTELIAALRENGDGALLETHGPLDREIGQVTVDSRAVRAGDLFVAVRGERADGHDFLDRAAASGACVLVTEPTHGQAREDATVLVVQDTRRALSRLAACRYGYPSRELNVVGITGTNGKTTTANLLAALLSATGHPAGCIGTLGARLGDRAWPLDNTTPPAIELQRVLHEMRVLGASSVAMEVSSHALALDRVADVRFAVGVLTNVTRDHLDFHKSIEAYAAAKRRLFDAAPVAVLTIDDSYGRAWFEELRAKGRRCVSYGFSPEAEVRAEEIELRGDGSAFTVNGRRFVTRLPARFNIANALAALSAARVLGISDATVAETLASFERVAGRMEHFTDGAIDVLVDYAHTPDALENVLRAAREMTRAGVTVVFGCGGDRDRGKRPQMGRLAEELADRVVVTSDNPRSEEPQAILAEILGGIRDASRVVVEPDREAAIRRAVARAERGDVVVVAGKGHETYQILGARTLHFDDREVVRAALAERATIGTEASR